MDRLDDAITVLEPRRRYTPTEIAKLAFPSDAQAVDVEAFRGWLKRTFVIAPMDDKGRRKRKSDRVKAIQSYFGGCFESGSRGLVFKMPDDMTDRAHRDEDFGQP